MKRHRVLIADDHALVRASIRRLIEATSEVDVVGEATNGRDVVAKAEALAPDIVLMDLLMPELNGLDAARQILARRPNIGVICLTMHANAEYLVEAKRLGVRGYILKESSADEIHQAIREVAAGGTWFAPPPDDSPGKSSRSTGSSSRLFQDLSPRQRQVLQLLVEGNSTRQIAEKMTITEHTVEKHRERIMAALGIHNLAGLVHFALESGLTQADY